MIPAIPVPAWPGSDRDAGLGPALLASNADRDVAAEVLCAAVADGRITLDELDPRLGAVLSARTLRDIAHVIADLPGPGPRDAEPALSPAETRWALLQSLVA